MKAQSRDAFERLTETNNWPPETGWPEFFKAVLFAACILVVAIDHVWVQYKKFCHLTNEIREGTISVASGPVALTILATAALVVAIVRDGTELHRHFSSYVALGKRLIKTTWQ